VIGVGETVKYLAESARAKTTDPDKIKVLVLSASIHFADILFVGMRDIFLLRSVRVVGSGVRDQRSEAKFLLELPETPLKSWFLPKNPPGESPGRRRIQPVFSFSVSG